MESITTAIASGPDDWKRGVARQGDLVGLADNAGRQANLLQLAVMLAALSFSMASLATIRRGVSATYLTVAATGLLSAAVVSIVAGV